MPEETNRARRESGALKSWLENIESISKIAAAIAIPIVIAVGGWWIQSSLSTQAVSKDYVTSTIDSSKKIAFWRGFSVVSALAYSPDGQKLLFGTSEGVVKLWNEYRAQPGRRVWCHWGHQSRDRFRRRSAVRLCGAARDRGTR
jgi:WD40 repeat protein